MKPDKYGRAIPDDIRPYVDIAEGLFSEHGLAHPVDIARALLEAEQRGRKAGLEEAAKVAATFREGNPKPTVYAAIAHAIRAKLDEVQK